MIASQRALVANKSVKRIFAAGEKGIWLDPSDMSTMFQDAYGLTPVTAVEQSARLMLDKSQGLQLGPELVTNGDFSNGSTGWTTTSGTVSFSNGSVTIGPHATLNSSILQSISTSLGKTYILSFSYSTTNTANVWLGSGGGGRSFNGTGNFYMLLTPNTGGDIYFRANAGISAVIDNVSVKELKGYHALASSDAKRPVLSARYNLLLATETLSTQSVTTVASTYTLKFTGTGSITLSGTKTGTYSAGTNALSGVTAGTLTLTVSGTVTQADLRVSNDGVGLPAYQRVNTATDYDTVGFPKYLKFSGGQCLVTPSIDFSGTDKMTVWAGVRKLSDAATAVTLELSNSIDSNNGSFALFSPSLSGSYSFRFTSKGTTAIGAGSSAFATAPKTVALIGAGSIGADVAKLTSNGSVVETSTGDQGTGNYGNYAINIGARADAASLHLTGRIYSLIVRGAASSIPTINRINQYVNGKTRAY